jgi:hypothetical protein
MPTLIDSQPTVKPTDADDTTDYAEPDAPTADDAQWWAAESSRDDDAWGLHPVQSDEDRDADAAYQADEQRRHEYAEWFAAECDRRAEEAAWLDAYESAPSPCY